MAAALHELEIIEPGIVFLALIQGFDKGSPRDVHQHNHMGKLEGGGPSDSQSGRQSGKDSPLGWSDKAFSAFTEIVALKIKQNQET